jgi:hypothetical protein
MVSQAIAARGSKRPFVLKKGISTLADLRDGAGAYGYPGDYPGRIYYVNNISGSSSYDGLSWDTPFDEVSTAITASETYRESFSGSTNDYIRNIIFVQGTGTAYSALTALPNYCDIIGIGADPRGNGAGIARIESATTADSISSAGVRGLGMYNLQVGGSSSGYAMDLAVCYRSIFENCVFVNKSTGALRIVTGGGITIRNCMIGGSDTTACANGLEISGTANFNNCLVEDNVIYGTTYGVIVNSYLCNATVFRNNFVYGGTIGIDDNSTESTLAGNAWYINNFVGSAADCISIATNDGVRVIGNICNQAGTTTWEDGF